MNTWRQSILNQRMLICVFTGFMSGMPLYLLYQLVPAWLRDEGVSLTEIGLFALVGIPYTWKFAWAPLMDRYVPPLLGRRRGWMIITQLGLLLLIGSLGLLQPAAPLESLGWIGTLAAALGMETQLALVAVVATAVALFSASQDVVLDAYRRELLPDAELGLGNSVHVTAYRVSSLVPGSLALVLADYLPWGVVYWVVAAFMLVGVALALAVREPDTQLPPASGLQSAVLAPFAEYWRRRGGRTLLLVLAFMLLYKLGDSMATALATPFYLDLGFSKTEIGLIAKHAALWPAIAGGLLGGLIMLRTGINRALWLFGVVQLLSILGYVVLAEAGTGGIDRQADYALPHDVTLSGQEALRWLLGGVIAFEYLGVGMGTAAFTAYIARETSKQFAATQFALFTAVTALPRTFANASTGVIVDAIGWGDFFLLCAALAVPGMCLLFWVAPWRESRDVLP